MTGTVPVNKKLLTGTVPVNKELLTGTVPVNNLFQIFNVIGTPHGQICGEIEGIVKMGTD